MSKKALLVLALLILPLSAFSASFHFSSTAVITEEPVTIYLSIDGLVDVKGVDVVLEWDAGIIACSGALFANGALPTFTEFHRFLDNDAGYLEMVLFQQCAGGCTGDADSFLVLTFDPVSSGSTEIIIRMIHPWGDPVLIDSSNGSIDFEVDTALVTVEYVDPVPEIRAVKLYQNYPNPFNPTTTIRFDIPERSAVYLRIYDIGGRLVGNLIEGTWYDEGTWSTEWDGRNDEGRLVPSGVYFLFIEAAGQESSRKLVILR